MFHRGTKRLEQDLDHPHRPMIKFQFYRTSEPTEPTWATTELTEDPFEYTGQAPYKQAIWQDIYREYLNCLHRRKVRRTPLLPSDWMGGQKSKANSDESVDVDVDELGAAMRDATVAGEQLRIGSGYSLGREAAGGNAEALKHLLGGIESAAEAERRAAMWGLSVAGSTAVAPLMERVALTPPTHENLETLSDLLLALGEAAVDPVSPLVDVVSGVMSALHDQIDVSAEVTLEETLEQWRLSTAFCDEKFKHLYARPEWKALASAAQSLMCVAQTAAAANDVDGCLKILDMIVKYSSVDVRVTTLFPHIIYRKTPKLWCSPADQFGPHHASECHDEYAGSDRAFLAAGGRRSEARGRSGSGERR